MNYHEPWTARPYPKTSDGPALPEHREASTRYPWLIMSCEEAEPKAEFMSLTSAGELILTSGQVIMASVGRGCETANGAERKEVAERIAACVNSMQGVEFPESWMKRCMDLLRRLREDGNKEAGFLVSDARR